MNNGSNEWGVSFSRISWLEGAISSHANVVNVSRHDDIILEIERANGPPVTAICLDEYAFGEAAAQRVFHEFPNVNFISVGGNWNGYTPEAKELCLSKKVGLYNSSELTGALWLDNFWDYAAKDKDGDPVYQYRSA